MHIHVHVDGILNVQGQDLKLGINSDADISNNKQDPKESHIPEMDPTIGEIDLPQVEFGEED